MKSPQSGSSSSLFIFLIFIGAQIPGSFHQEVPGALSKSTCPVAFTHIGESCYFYGYFRLNWFRAMEFCHTFGDTVSLSALDTPKENNDVKNWLLDHGDHRTGVWIGGSDNGHVGKWAWFPTGQRIQDFDWAPSQPNGSKDHQHCIYIVGGFFGYQWADFNCDYEMTFLCEYGVNRERSAWRKKKSLSTPSSSSSSSTISGLKYSESISLNQTIQNFLAQF
ncbi:lithostathine-1-like [Lepeophtheirus salmonis]|uniref:lithostathine-1-like n=1 Tax=Lepeophtheirus salmonis TaxID=72036 RepID=UPI001AEADE6E|nr:perlucin-like [Lepeophtheirus salmonis]